MKSLSKEYIISLSFGNYLKGDGGVDKAIREHQEMFNNYGVSYVHISPLFPNILDCLPQRIKLQIRLYSIVINGRFYGVYDENEIKAIVNGFAGVIKAFHIHHIKKFQYQFIKAILEASDAQKYFFIHDYYTVCQHPNLLRNGKDFCGVGLKNSKNCSGCVYSNTIDRHQSFTKQLFKDFPDMLVISPSIVAADIWCEAFNGLIPKNQIHIIPHQNAYGKNSVIPVIDSKIKIAFLGRFDENKGANAWRKIVNYINTNHLPYELFYLGFSDVNLENVKKINVRVNKSHPNMMVETLKKHGINCAFLWSICPETYSYAYFEAYSANAFIITNSNSGNIAAMTKANCNGLIFDSVSDLIDAIHNTESFRNKVCEFSVSGILGPLYYENNKNVLSLQDTKSNTIHINKLRCKVPLIVKKIIETGYIKRNHLIIYKRFPIVRR